MPDDNEAARLFSELRADFDDLARRRGFPIQLRLIHKATNAEQEGVVGLPPSHYPVVGLTGAGHRQFRRRFDANGRPLYVDPAIVDAEGKPIVEPKTGKGLDVELPASRSVVLSGESGAVARLTAIAKRAGKALDSCRHESVSLLKGWQFSGEHSRWWALVFELAWSGRLPLLKADRWLWIPRGAGQPSTMVRWDLEQLRHAAANEQWCASIPQNWLKRLPDTYVSEIEDAVSACADVARMLASIPTETKPADQAPVTPTANKETPDPAVEGKEIGPIRIPARSATAAIETKKRFRVALSFPGERRDFVAGVAGTLSERMGKQSVFYDKYYEADLARPNLDTHLQRIYYEEADLIVVFLCADYEQKKWCGLELRAIRALIMNKQDHAIMLIRFDETEIPGLYPIDGYVSVNDRPPSEIAGLILERLGHVD